MTSQSDAVIRGADGRSWGAEPFFVLRTTLLPVSQLVRWGSGLTALAVAEAGGDVAAAWARDRERLHRRLRVAWSQPEVRAAVGVASPGLSARSELSRAHPGSLARDVEPAIVRYLQRMAFRCTPFGLFAGCALGATGDRTSLVLGPRADHRRHTRLDGAVLAAVIGRLELRAGLRGALRWFPASGLYRVGPRVRNVEAHGTGAARRHVLADCLLDAPLAVALDRAEGGARIAEIAEALGVDGADSEEAAAYVEDLIRAQLLVSEITPGVTGADALQALIDRLPDEEGARRARRDLQKVQESLRALDAGGLVGDGAALRRAEPPLRRLLGDLPERRFQVDLVPTVSCAVLGHETIAELGAAVEVLSRLAPARRPGALDRFRKDFVDRWGEREVPLAVALDDEVGIGFGGSDPMDVDGAPLLRGVPLHRAPEPPAMRWDPRTRWIRGQLDLALRTGAEEIVLEESDLEECELPRSDGLPLPDAFAVLASVLRARGPEDPVAELHHVHGPSGARLLGRFCHGDPELAAAVRRHLAAEEALHPEVTFFEVAHLPEGGVGNVAARPALREYELAYLAHPGVPASRSLSIRDLLVTVCGDRIVLRARGREVRPRLTCAHETRYRSVPVYRFLAALQCQGVRPGLAWSWEPFGDSEFLPRVRSGRVILAPRRWNVRVSDLGVGPSERGAVAFAAAARWRRERGLPHLVGLVDGDHVLPVDFRNVLSVEAFLSIVRGRDRFRLTEIDPRGDAVEGPGGRFRNEVVVPFLRRTGVSAPPGVRPAVRRLRGEARRPWSAVSPPGSSFRHDFAPGSEWLYARIEAGPSGADRVLQEVIRPIVSAMGAAPPVDDWFFVRYADPRWHLRVRFRGDAGRLAGRLLPALHRRLGPLLESGVVHGFGLETYRRETQRYGGPEGITRCERIFRHDSDACVDLLAGIRGSDGADDLRWRLALAGVDRLLGDFGFDLLGRHRIVAEWAGALERELGFGGVALRAVRSRLRKERESICRVIQRDAPDRGPGGGVAPLERRSQRQRLLVRELRELDRAGELSVPLPAILGSLAHMHTNRMFRTAARAQEAVLYRFLERAYDSLLARRRRASRVPEMSA